MIVLIMAGGSGTRFWPLSRKNTPKQFLKLWGNETLLNLTLERVTPLTSLENIFIVTGKEYEAITRQYAPELAENIILEPFGRNTAACIGLSSLYMQEKGYGDEPMLVCPADHLIKNGALFRKTVKKAEQPARDGYLVVIGISPTEPSPNYGYIEKGEGSESFPGLFVVKKFVEKPSRERAQQMLETGNYYWNAGIFLWTPNVILEEIRKYMPELHRGLEKIKSEKSAKKREKVIEEVYKNLDSVPIDIGVLERSDRLLMVGAEMDWCDVGNWSSLCKVVESDEAGNVVKGATVTVGAKGCVLWSSGRLVTAVGVENLAVVETEDAVLVCNLDKDQDIKKLHELMEKAGYGKYR